MENYSIGDEAVETTTTSNWQGRLSELMAAIVADRRARGGRIAPVDETMPEYIEWHAIAKKHEWGAAHAPAGYSAGDPRCKFCFGGVK